MIDEQKQTENVANQESQQQTTNEVTAKTMNSNAFGDFEQANAPEVDANTPSSENSVEVEKPDTSSTASDAELLY